MNEWLLPVEGDAMPVVLLKYGASWLLLHGLKIVLVLLVAWLAVRMVGVLARRILARAGDGHAGVVTESEKRAKTLAQVLTYVTKIFVWASVTLMILRETGLDVAPFLAGAGIAGIALGFGAQSLVKDVLAGVFILTESQFRVGDVVELVGKSGVVEEINLRTTLLRSLDGTVHIVPNGQIAVASNMTHRWSRAVLDVQVGYDADLDLVEGLLVKVGAELKSDPKWSGDLLEDPQVMAIESFGDNAVTVRVMVKTQPLRQWDVARQLRRRIKRALDDAKIEIPFPQRVIHYKMPPPPIPTPK